MLAKLLSICSLENLSYTDDGLEAVVFTAQGDMRQALNNLQSTAQGFNHVSAENVFKVELETRSIKKRLISINMQLKFESAV